MAIIAVQYPICYITYGWLNEIRALESVFCKVCMFSKYIITFIMVHYIM